jgi:hypothetical protein
MYFVREKIAVFVGVLLITRIEIMVLPFFQMVLIAYVNFKWI